MIQYKTFICATAFTLLGFQSIKAQINESSISAGFFDSSEANTINYSSFKLPPLGVLFENAKQNPNILSLAKAQEIAQEEVAKQKKQVIRMSLVMPVIVTVKRTCGEIVPLHTIR